MEASGRSKQKHGDQGLLWTSGHCGHLREARIKFVRLPTESLLRVRVGNLTARDHTIVLEGQTGKRQQVRPEVTAWPWEDVKTLRVQGWGPRLHLGPGGGARGQGQAGLPPKALERLLVHSHTPTTSTVSAGFPLGPGRVTPASIFTAAGRRVHLSL